MINGAAHCQRQNDHGETNGVEASSTTSSSVSSLVSLRELIIMTPVSQGDSNSHLIRVERLKYDANSANLPNDVLHVAGGQHSGIVVRKQIAYAEAVATKEETEIALDFNVYLVDAISGHHKQENRQLRLWYVESVSTPEMHHVAFEFLKSLLVDCPKDYIGFVKKIMKLMQQGYIVLRKVEIEMRMLEEPAVIPELDSSSEVDDNDVLFILERAYPNSVAADFIASTLHISLDQVETHLSGLQDSGKVTLLETGQWLIVDTVEKSILKHMPTVGQAEQPTIALITSLYVEKLAVDAMIEKKEVFIRYKTDGESNIYTLGNIGGHRVVATKLSSIGQHSIAAGSITTRLLGGYPQIQHVLVIGVGGGVPNFTDKETHVRLGDVVVSAPASFGSPLEENTQDESKNVAYVFCDSIKRDRETESVIGYMTKTWCPKCTTVADTAQGIVMEQRDEEQEPWSTIFGDAAKVLSDGPACSIDASFGRPKEDSDVLTVDLGGGNVATVSHPDRRCKPRLYLGPVGAGSPVSLRNAECRQDFAHRYHLKAFDAEFDSVVESIFGNRIDSWALIRGIADYGDGTKNKQWQAYAALQAASVARMIIERLPPSKFDSE